MATVYDALGAKITMVELLDQLIPGCDPDLLKPLQKRVSGRYEAIHLGTKVESVEAKENALHVQLSSGETHKFDGILVAIGRRPNGRSVGAPEAGVNVDDAGFIPVDRQMRTNVAGIYAIGDVVGGPMLAHKASHEGKVAAEVIAGVAGAEFDPRAIPSVAYTDPEVAWMGLTETEAKDTLHVQLSSGETHKFDGILVAIGRRPNGPAIGASAAGVEVDDAGFIQVDRQMRTNVPHIYAIGDVVGGPMLAHKASHVGRSRPRRSPAFPGRSSTRARFRRWRTPTPRSPGWD
jgi:pyruvate/2-oxoglutarate dehydrogenase complex dihydrolipoamide dehydrogenase (E3) component